MLSPDSNVSPRFSRRRLLVNGGRGLFVLAALGVTTTACGSPTPPPPDPLEAQLESAQQDSALATTASKTAEPAIAPALMVIANERAQHATALTEEIARAAGKPIPTTSAPSTASLSTASSGTASSGTASSSAATSTEAQPTTKDVISALRASAESAAKLVPTLSGYRAGLLGSIAAACTTAYAVALTPTGGQQ